MISKEFQPRDWQARFVRRYQTLAKSNFLLEACTSAGKTAGTVYLYDSLKKNFDWKFFIAVVPSELLKQQYAQDAHQLFGYRFYYSGTSTRLGRLPTPAELMKRGYEGMVISYQFLATGENSLQLNRAIGEKVAGQVLVVLDEVHHASEELAFGEAAERAFPDSLVTHRLMTTGTPFRSDNRRILGNWIPYVPTEEEGDEYVCSPDFQYTLADALTDEIIPPFSFVTLGGEFKYLREQVVYEGKTFENATTEQELTDALNTAIAIDGDWVKEAIFWAWERMKRDRAQGFPECATYVRVANISAAYQMRERIQRLTGENALIVVSKGEEGGTSASSESYQKANQAIEQFAKDSGSHACAWIIGVNMLGEGVSIPRLKYRLHVTNVRARLSFEQDTGRLLRLFPKENPQAVETLLPPHPVLIDFAKEILNRVAHVVREKQSSFLETEYELEEGEEIDTEALGEPIPARFLPLASTGIFGSQVVEGEEIDADYAVIAEWAIYHHELFSNWQKTPAHLAQKLRKNPSFFRLIEQEYRTQGNQSYSRTQEREFKIPVGFPSEYAEFLPDQKIAEARRRVNRKVNQLAFLRCPQEDEAQRTQIRKSIHTQAKLQNGFQLDEFIGYEGWEKIYEWLLEQITNVQGLSGGES